MSYTLIVTVKYFFSVELDFVAVSFLLLFVIKNFMCNYLFGACSENGIKQDNFDWMRTDTGVQ